MYQLAVLGNPIHHSLSPLLFNLFAAQCDIELNYARILALDTPDFKQKVTEFFNTGGTALNVTSPFKQDAYTVANMHTSRAAFCRTSNFLRQNHNGTIIADTTDGIGLVTDMMINRNLNLENKQILIIGSGYVLESLLLYIISKNPLNIDLLARNTARIDSLRQKFATGVFDSQKNYDIILNSTPNSPDNNLFEQIEYIADDTFCYDLTYAQSLFLTMMHNLNPKSSGCNGLGMLVEQAKVAFVKLFARTPDTADVFISLAKMGYHV